MVGRWSPPQDHATFRLTQRDPEARTQTSSLVRPEASVQTMRQVRRAGMMLVSSRRVGGGVRRDPGSAWSSVSSSMDGGGRVARLELFGRLGLASISRPHVRWIGLRRRGASGRCRSRCRRPSARPGWRFLRTGAGGRPSCRRRCRRGAPLRTRRASSFAARVMRVPRSVSAQSSGAAYSEVGVGMARRKAKSGRSCSSTTIACRAVPPVAARITGLAMSRSLSIRSAKDLKSPLMPAL